MYASLDFIEGFFHSQCGQTARKYPKQYSESRNNLVNSADYRIPAHFFCITN